MRLRVLLVVMAAVLLITLLLLSGRDQSTPWHADGDVSANMPQGPRAGLPGESSQVATVSRGRETRTPPNTTGGVTPQDVRLGTRQVVLPDGGVILTLPPRLLLEESRQPGEKRKEWKKRVKNAAADDRFFEEEADRDPPRLGLDGGHRAWPVVINEIMASNQTATVDERGQFDDWVEIHNRASVELDVGGCAITNDPANPSSYLVLPEGFVMAPRGFVVVFADGKPRQGPLHANFKLKAEGDLVVVMDPDGNVLDQLVFGPQAHDVSLGRLPDGTGTFMTLFTPTPGGPNARGEPPDAGMPVDAGALMDAGPTPPAVGVVFNELMADNVNTVADEFGEMEDWIELFNASAAQVDLTNHILTDGSEKTTPWRFPAGTVLAPGAFLLVWADQQAHQGPLHASFKLSAQGEMVVLMAPDGTVLDTQGFGAMPRNGSEGRIPNGRGAWVRQVKPTPGLPNLEPPDAGSGRMDAGPTVQDGGTTRPDGGAPSRDAGLPNPRGVVLNEWVANNTTGQTDEVGEREDWVELYNTGAQSAELSGTCLSDEPTKAGKWCFPEGVVVEPHGFLLVFADNEADGPLHASFKLSTQGETLVLTAPDGTELDRVTFGAQRQDTAQGRLPDGTGAVVTLGAPSPAAPNVR